MTEDDIELIKNIASNNRRAQDAEREGNVRRELQAHLWVLQDTMRLLVWWNDGSSEIDSRTAQSYTESAVRTVAWVRELVAVRMAG